MKVTDDGETLTFTAELGEIALSPDKDFKNWYILFEGFIPMSKFKVTSITFTRRDEYEEEGWKQGHASITVRSDD
jgi:hypothetical protein